jgi:hypothetical protein
MRAHFTRDVSSDVPVKYDTQRYDIASYSISRLELSIPEHWELDFIKDM